MIIDPVSIEPEHSVGHALRLWPNTGFQDFPL